MRAIQKGRAYYYNQKSISHMLLFHKSIHILKEIMKTTGFVILIVMIFLGLFDLYQYCILGIDGTISKFFQVLNYKNPFPVHVLFYIAGHCLSGMYTSDIDKLHEEIKD